MEIRSIGVSSASTPRVADRTAQGSPPVQLPATVGATAPQTSQAVTQASGILPAKQLDDAVKDLNETMKSLSQNLEFAIDPDSNRTVVKVIDQQTREVLRQLPSRETLEIAKALDRLQGLLISQKA